MSRPLVRVDPKTQCEGKHPYETMARAKRVALLLRGANAYRCPYCLKFHVGHAAPKPFVRRVRSTTSPAINNLGNEE